MWTIRCTILAFLSLTGMLAGVGCTKGSDATVTTASGASQPAEVTIGYFGNLTHAQAVLGVYSGEFASAIAPSALKTKVFNAGPSLIEALIAHQIDIGYVGPGPALNAQIRTHGEGIRILAGAASNGVLIVAGKDSGIHSMEDLKGKRLATPQVGNTQDIAAKYYLSHVLHEPDLHNVLSFDNSQQGGLMERGEIDASWAPAPWGSRLIAEAGAHLVAKEKDLKELWPGGRFVLTLVVTTPEFLKDHPDVVEKMLAVHHRWTLRLQRDARKYVPQLADALYAISQKRLPKGVLESSIENVGFLDDPLPDTLHTMAKWAHELNFAPRPANLNGLIDTRILDSIRARDAH